MPNVRPDGGSAAAKGQKPVDRSLTVAHDSALQFSGSSDPRPIVDPSQV